MSFGQPPGGNYGGPPGGGYGGPPAGDGGGGGGGWAQPPGPPAGGGGGGGWAQPPGGMGGPPQGGGGGGWGPPPGGMSGPPQGGGGGGWGPPPAGMGGAPGYGQQQPMYTGGVPGGPSYHQSGGGATDPVAIVSLVLGLVSLPMHFCCYLGWPLGIGAIVCGIIAMSRSGDPPNYYSGKGLAVGGIIAAAFGFLMIILVLVFWGAAVMMSKP